MEYGTAPFFTVDAFVISFVYKDTEDKYSKVRRWDARAQPKECILSLHSLLLSEAIRAVFINVSKVCEVK